MIEVLHWGTKNTGLTNIKTKFWTLTVTLTQQSSLFKRYPSLQWYTITAYNDIPSQLTMIYHHSLQWYTITAYNDVPSQLTVIYHHSLQWYTITAYNDIPSQLTMIYHHSLQWYTITAYNDIPSQLTMIYHHSLQWYTITAYNDIPSQLTMIYHHSLQWYTITAYNDKPSQLTEIYHQTMIGSQWMNTSKNIAEKLTYWLDNDNEHTNKICQWVCWPVWQLTVCPAACLEVGLHLPWLADSSHFAWNICAVKIKPKASKSLKVSITVYDHQETVVLVEWWSLGHLHCRNILNIITTWLAGAGKTGKTLSTGWICHTSHLILVTPLI